MKPLNPLYPQEWKDKLPSNLDMFEFRNLQHFKLHVSQLRQKEDMKCNISYEDALHQLMHNVATLDVQEYMSIRDTVRKNLLKRGLITNEIYEAYKDDTTMYGSKPSMGIHTTNDAPVMLDVDIGAMLAGHDCVVTNKAHKYKDTFHELYISISYPYTTTNEQVTENVVKLLSTIEELERQHYYIKLTVIVVSHNLTDSASSFVTIPIFSHKDHKSISTMSAVVNNRLLRKFMFAFWEDRYQDSLRSNYGTAVNLPKTVNIGGNVEPIKLWENITLNIWTGNLT